MATTHWRGWDTLEIGISWALSANWIVFDFLMRTDMSPGWNVKSSLWSTASEFGMCAFQRRPQKNVSNAALKDVCLGESDKRASMDASWSGSMDWPTECVAQHVVHICQTPVNIKVIIVYARATRCFDVEAE